MSTQFADTVGGVIASAPRAPSSTTALDTSPVRWLLLAAGLAMLAYAWQTRQPPATSDFTIFYVSAKRPPAEMYVRPAGPPRGNMNPPQFQLIVRPLTRLSLTVASEVWRGLNLLALCGCMWWLAQRGRERWTAADVGAGLAWAPFYHAFVLNQLAWILWPLLVWAWSEWRKDRWVPGAIGFGLALSFKIFLGVFLIWLALRRQWRALAVAIATAAASLGVGAAVYGAGVYRAWVGAMARAEWPGAFTNASLRGLVDRGLTRNFTGAPPLLELPALALPLYLTAAGLVLAVTLYRTRDRSVDASWPALMASALLASPLGWAYYMWWMLPGTRPSRVLFLSPLLWVPVMYLTRGQPSGWATVTFGSLYGWGLLLAWRGFVSRPSC